MSGLNYRASRMQSSLLELLRRSRYDGKSPMLFIAQGNALGSLRFLSHQQLTASVIMAKSSSFSPDARSKSASFSKKLTPGASACDCL